jgi:G6PDH family F420-dependent oxidoreductase
MEVRMARIGYTLSSEEHGPQTLINNAALAEDAGFDFVGISDHFAPWTETQGHSSFVWTVLGGIAQATADIGVLVEVTCPIMRYHPAIVAQAAATSASLLEGRFSLGVGTGEYLNEHVVGEGWPHIDVRREMLAEAVDIIRKLWSGHYIDHYGEYFTVEQGKIYTLPDELPPIIVSGLGPKSIALAGQIGDGLVSLAPSPEFIKTFDDNGGRGKSKYAQINVCYASTREEAANRI